MEPVYVFGHKNPDTDSICSAIAYAQLKNIQASGHIPARLGELNHETEFVLDRFDVSTPVFLPHVYVRAQDVMTSPVITAAPDVTIFHVGELMRKHEIRAIPITDEEGRAQGVVNERALARNYLREFHIQNLRDTATDLAKMASTLDAEILLGEPDTKVTGKAFIASMSLESMVQYLSPGDIVIAGNRENAQEAALGCRIACLVVTGDFTPSNYIQQLAHEKGTAVLVTPHDTFAAARLINLSVPATRLLQEDVMRIDPESLVNEITPELLESRHDVALVNDEAGKLVGVLTKSDIVARRRRQVILVDHSERSQSADGIERAEILEILDHHRLGGLETSGPILAMIAPVGCSATLVLRRYKEFDVTPPREMAGLMVAAILSDTMLLKSPTTTPEDIAAVEHLGAVLGEAPLNFGREMYNAKFDMATLSPLELATADMKSFAFGNATVAISQVEVGDKETVLVRKQEILDAMQHYQKDKGLDLFMLMVTDIFQEGTELLAVGKTRAVERAFDTSLTNHSVYLPGVLSRKKQVVPPISTAF
ncbi:MAG: putative manganese-dependent inorganic diphosphatase [Chloroflexota bacterium]|nr:putative manganese-dependent inorganic diphosphatase [Chloroflexota bacterium]